MLPGLDLILGLGDENRLSCLSFILPNLTSLWGKPVHFFFFFFLSAFIHCW